MKIFKKIMGFILAALVFIFEVVAITAMTSMMVLCLVMSAIAFMYGDILLGVVCIMAIVGLFMILLEASK